MTHSTFREKTDMLCGEYVRSLGGSSWDPVGSLGGLNSKLLFLKSLDSYPLIPSHTLLCSLIYVSEIIIQLAAQPRNL